MDIDGMLDEANREREALKARLRDVDRLIVLLHNLDHRDQTETRPTLDLGLAQLGLLDADPVEADLEATYPKPRDAILMTMERFPGRLFAPKDVTKMVRELGLYNPELQSGATAYSTALSRLADEEDSSIRRAKNGNYFFDATRDGARRDLGSLWFGGTAK